MVAPPPDFEIDQIEATIAETLGHAASLLDPQVLEFALSVGALRGGLEAMRGRVPLEDFPARLAVHKAEAFPVEHEAIIDEALWAEVHDVLANNRVARIAVARAPAPALLRGLIFTESGVAKTPHLTKKGTRLYRYYV